jgi:hypothetical protein
LGLLASVAQVLAHAEREVGCSIIPSAMEILRLTIGGQVQGSALGRKLRVKMMQHIGLLEIGPSRGEEIEVSETLEGVIDFLLSSLSDKVLPSRSVELT